MKIITFIKNHNLVFAIPTVLVLLIISFGAGRYTLPTKVITKTQTVSVDKVVTQIQTVTKIQKVYVHDVQKNVVTTTDTIKKPDGTVETKTMTTNLSKSEVSDKIQASSLSVSDLSDKTSSKSETITSSAKPQWFLALKLGAGSSFPGLSPKLDLGIEVNKRLLGPVFVGVWLDLQSPVAPIVPNSFLTGVSLGLEL